MLIVVVSPSFPRFDATTHYWQAEFASVVAFLRGRFPSASVVAVPAGLICAPDRIIVRELLAQPDFLVLWSRVWEAPAARKLAELAREISPRTRVLAWVDGPLFMPQYFRREPFDAVVSSGDPELVLADAIQLMAVGGLPEHGMLVKAADSWIETERGRWLEPAAWPFPESAPLEGLGSSDPSETIPVPYYLRIDLILTAGRPQVNRGGEVHAASARNHVFGTGYLCECASRANQSRARAAYSTSSGRGRGAVHR
jgi:hypothetical protein